MTNEEAITLLKDWKKVLCGEGEYFEALDLAIKALELKIALENGEELMPRLNDDLR